MQIKPKKGGSLHEVWRGVTYSLGRAKKHKKIFFKIIFLSFFTALLSPLTLILWSKILDTLTYRLSDVTRIWEFEIMTVVLIIALYLMTHVILDFAERVMGLAMSELREILRVTYLADLAYHIFRLPLSVIKTIKQGEFTDTSRRAAASLSALVIDYIIVTGTDVLSVLFLLGVIFYHDWVIGLITVSGILLALLFSSRDTDDILKLEKSSTANYKIAGGLYDDAITNIKAIKDFATEKKMHDSLLVYWVKKAFPIRMELNRLRRWSSFRVFIITLATRAIVLVLSVKLILSGDFTVGVLVLMWGFVRDCINPFIRLLNNWREIQTNIIHINESQELLAIPEEKYKTKEGFVFEDGQINFDDVTFIHSGNTAPTLAGVTISIASGQKVAIVGESGVGKSTFVDLLFGYYNLEKGVISIDGQDIQTHDLHALRKQIAVVPQDIVLFNDTIKNNILFGSEDAVSEEELMQIARDAHCLEFIEKFPQGFDQLVGDRGIRLSGGQRQRIAIARAMLRKPKILILDEPTSALDAGTEKIITESLEKLMEGRTTIIIAHRLSTVRRADSILVFKNGTIVEQGTHAELLAREAGEYKRLHDLQIGLS
jgi:ABC-type multidrug transport system fused ATPase/permease subunit